MKTNAYPHIYMRVCAGIRCIDASVLRGEGRRFDCRVCLLAWTGDYPATAASSGTHSKCCHWCRMKSAASPEINRRTWGDFRRYLPEGHALRGAHVRLGPRDTRPPPAPRTHSEYVEQGLANEHHEHMLALPDARSRGVFKKDLPRKVTGIKESCPFRFLPFFDIVWDFCPEMMHIISGIWKRHVFQMFAGKRTPSTVKVRKKNTFAENEKLSQAHSECKEWLQSWILSKEKSCLVDQRTLALAGEPTWVRSNIQMMGHSGALNDHDWMTIVHSAGDYVLADLFDNPCFGDALYALLDVCRQCVEFCSTCVTDNRADVDRLKLAMAEALTLCEQVFPSTELCVMLHILMHVPDSIYRWNNVRNTWAFFGERSMGHFIRFINNRDLAVENIMTAYVRWCLVRDCEPGFASGLAERLRDSGCPLPKRSILRASDDARKLIDDVPGVYGVHTAPSRRNSELCKWSDYPRIGPLVESILNVTREEREYNPDWEGEFTRMIAGVKLNGRGYEQGCYCKYAPRVRQRYNLEGPGGLAGVVDSFKIGKVDMFYVVPMVGGQGRVRRPEVFVAVADLPVTGRVRSLYEVNVPGVNVGDPGFEFELGEDKSLMHIDSIVAKVKLVPHFDPGRTDTMCAITMWEAR